MQQGPAVLLASVAILPVGAEAAIIYGLGGPTNEMPAIGTATGSTTVAGRSYDVSPDANDSPNGLGYDTANNRLYFTGGAANQNFYRAVPGAPTVTNLGSLNATMGADYYFWTETGELRRVVNANSATNPVSSSLVLRRTGIPGAGNFGDIIAGTLFGIRSSTDKIFSVSLAEGASTQVSTLAHAALFTTAAASVVPLPAAIWLFCSAFLGLCWLGRRSATRGIGMLPR